MKEKRLVEYAESFPEAAKNIYKWMDKVKSSNCCINTIEFKDVWSITEYIGNKRFVCDIIWNRFRLVVGMDPKRPKIVFIRWFGKHRDYDRLVKSGRIYDI